MLYLFQLSKLEYITGVADLDESLFDKVILVMTKFEEGTLKGQHQSKSKKYCKASSFKELRTMSLKNAEQILDQVLASEISVYDINDEAKTMKQIEEVQLAMVDCLAADSWASLEEKYVY